MASKELPAILVARFLKANHFVKTLDIFLREANIDSDASDATPDDLTLERLVREKQQFDTSNSFERVNDAQNIGWLTPHPGKAIVPAVSIKSNVLSVNCSPSGRTFAVTTATNVCNLINSVKPYPSVGQGAIMADSPILSTAFLSDDVLIASTMSGKVALFATRSSKLLAERRDHNKWVVKVVCCKIDAENSLIATAGWDQRIHLYRVRLAGNGDMAEIKLQSPFHTIDLQSNPESLLFTKHPDSNQLYLVVSRRDSSFLYYYRCNVLEGHDKASLQIHAAGKQNLAPHSNAWVAFSPAALALHPKDPTLVAIATSHLPFLKLIIVRLLFPDVSGVLAFAEQAPPMTAATQARAELALQDREDAAITLQVSTQAPQTPYSTPQVCWRPSGNGVWTNGDDGVIRGVDVRTGKVVAHLIGHEAQSKVRTLWAGLTVANDSDAPPAWREVMVSGAFDKKLIVWDMEG